MRAPIIAIDGPSGAGKGTVARAVADARGYAYVDTGAMYRAVGWKALRAGISLEDEEAVKRLAGSAAIESSASRVAIDGIDVTGEIRTPEMDRAAASVARLPGVRAILVAIQRTHGARGGVVMEGRDIGTVVFPDADVKIYLDATPEERARRRANDRAHASGSAALAEVASQLSERDRIDSTRAASPLVIAPDAELVDTTGRSVSDVVADVIARIDRKLGARPRSTS